MSHENGPEQAGELSWGEKVIQLRDLFEGNGIPYAFGGAIAVNYYRDPRSTRDIDVNLFLTPDDRELVLDNLDSLYGLPDRDRVERMITQDAQVRTKWGVTHVDLFFTDIDFHRSMAERVRRLPFQTTEINVLSVEDLMICKILFNRPRDWIDIEAVVASQGDQLDYGYIRSWLSEFVASNDERVVHLREIVGPDGA